MGDLDPDVASEEDVLQAAYGADPQRWQAVRAADSAVLTSERPYHWVHGKMPDERIRLAPEILVEQLASTRDPEPAGLVLINRRLLRKNNSQLADGHGLARPSQPETLLHPDDAAERGIAEGGSITVTSAHGSMRTTARLDDRACRGTVSTPHGFVQANATRLTSGEDVDPLTGMPRTTGLPVTVTPG